MHFEVCIDSVAGAIIASQYGAKRVELCAALSEGGLTPSLAMVEACVKNSKAAVFAMIRPSAGGFNYTDTEILLMQREIQMMKEVGASGVVFGALNNNHEVDIQKNMFLIETALKLNLGTTFHRAIDTTPNLLNALDDIIHIGFDRVLTSGGAANVSLGIETLKHLADKADGSIEIMAGCGVNPENVKKIISTGVQAVHFTAHTILKENLHLDMGPKTIVNEDKIQRICEQLT